MVSHFLDDYDGDCDFVADNDDNDSKGLFLYFFYIYFYVEIVNFFIVIVLGRKRFVYIQKVGKFFFVHRHKIY